MQVSASDMSPAARLLAIDDDPDSAGLLARIAAKSGYQSQSITDPRRIGQMLNDWCPDIVTLDLCMPWLDGIEALSVLQASGFAGHVVIVSGLDRETREAARALGEARGLKVADNFSKPVDTKALRELLSRLKKVH